MTRSLRERLLSKAVIDFDTGCWRWTAGKTTNGYGKFSIGLTSQRAHRVAYELIEGPIPAGLDLDHLCRNRACINPAHLEPVTRRENLRRSPITLPALYVARTHCNAGHAYDAENTLMEQDGSRRCRACKRENGKRRPTRARTH